LNNISEFSYKIVYAKFFQSSRYCMRWIYKFTI